MKQPSITITAAQAAEAKASGKDPYAYAAERFRDEHGLIFSSSELRKGHGFTYEKEVLDRAFRITYLGNQGIRHVRLHP